MASGIIILQKYARRSHVKAEGTSLRYGFSLARNVTHAIKKRAHDDLMPDQTHIEWKRYQRTRTERLARELDAAVRAYSEAYSESVLKEDLASDKDETAETRCIFYR